MLSLSSYVHLKIGIVMSEFNNEISSKLLEGAVSRLKHHGIPEQAIQIVKVPGAVEIPFAAQCLIQYHTLDAIIALGAVIQGETNHYDYVCQQVSNGCQRVMLDHNIPVAFGVLTTQNVAQALDRVGGAHGHKGVDAADTALHMIAVKQQIMRSDSRHS